MSDKTDEQAALWNGPAGRAWVDAQATLDAMYQPFEALLADAVTAGSGGAAIDVGCGTGATTLAVTRALGPNGRALGVDISQPMLALARARAERAGVAATFTCADAQRHAFEPAGAAAIVSRFGVMFFDDPTAAFANLRRAANEEARLRVIVWRGAADNPFMTTAERAAAPLLPSLPPRRPNAAGQFAFADDTRVQEILAASGWTDVEIQPLDVECALPEPELTRYLSRLGPVGLALEQADAPTRARVLETVRAAFEPFVHGAEVRFTAGCWLVDARAGR